MGGKWTNYGRAALSEFLGDRVAYRNLEPADPGLPGLKELSPSVGLPPGQIPRKTELDYARVVHAMLEEAQRARGVNSPLRRLLFVGDTRLLDGSAFANLGLVGDWPGLAFIAAEDSRPPGIEVVPAGEGRWLYLTNRWSALPEFDRYARARDFSIDESTALILDIDKTALGARGRNGQVIDEARLQAVEETVAALLGAAFDREGFRAAYQRLNAPEFHPFTLDNQDYLAYLCLVLGSGLLYRLEAFVDDLWEGRLGTFEEFMGAVEGRRGALPAGLAGVHAEIYDRVKAGDPTPFKTFRRREYLVTIQRFGHLPEGAAAQEVLAQEIAITQEVREAVLGWQKEGALLIGLSDKPDEAAAPTPELASQGYQPIHRAETHAVGEGRT